MADGANATGQEELRIKALTPAPRTAQPLGANNPYATPGVIHRGGELVHNTGQVIHRGGEVMHRTPLIHWAPPPVQKTEPASRVAVD
jgi:hypothetical protein